MKLLRVKYILLLGFFASSCSTIQKTPAVGISVSDSNAVIAYAKVLGNFVNDKGEINFDGLAKDKADLETYISYVANKKFSDFSSKEILLAHHLNAYNALSMYTVIQKGIPKTNAGFKKVKFFFLTKMDVGGTQMSLVDYENKFIRTIGEDRVHWALNCMAVSCPRLPRKPFVAATLNQDLQALSVEFFNANTNARIDEAEKTVHVTEILKFFPKDFVPSKAPSILDYVNLYRTAPVPTNYEVEYISYDWTINNSNRH